MSLAVVAAPTAFAGERLPPALKPDEQAIVARRLPLAKPEADEGRLLAAAVPRPLASLSQKQATDHLAWLVA